MHRIGLRRLHRRLAVVMGLAALLAFAGGAGFEPLSTLLAGTALVTALFWQPSPELSSRLERIWVPLAGVLVLRALFHVFLVGDDVVIPVVDLLLLLLSAESLRSLDAPNDVRLYALSFALLLASAAYRPGIAFGVAFVAYVAVGTVALTVGHLRRETRRTGTGRIPVEPGLLFGVAGLSAVTLLLSAAVFVTFPRAARSWTNRAEVSPAPVVGFGDEVDLGSFGSTIRGNPRVVLRVEFTDDPPSRVGSLYWRGRSYDHFDGRRWSRSARLPPALAPERWYEERWPGERVEQTIYAAPLQSRVLFGLHPIVDIDAESAIQPHFDNAGDFTYWGSAAPAYRATSVAGRPPPSELRTANGRFAPAREHYLQLPELPRRVHALGDSLAAGLGTRYDRVVAVRDWLRSEFSYTLELPRTRGETSLDHFLFERRRGHCEYFSTAMTILLRTQGIPARNVNGFLGGEWSEFGDYLAVTQNEAHSWVEVWFPDFGWVAFDPTPAGPREAAAQDSLTRARAAGVPGVDTVGSTPQALTPGPNEPGATAVPDGTASDGASDGETPTVPRGLLGPGDGSSGSGDGGLGGGLPDGETALYGLILLVGAATAAHRTGLLARGRRLVWIRRSPDGPPARRIEATFDRLDYLLGRRYRPRRAGETPRAYLRALRARVGPVRDDAAATSRTGPHDRRVDRLFDLYEQAHYAGRATAAEADRAWRVFCELREEWSPRS